ncbi:GyrI-like domain-containing protein [Cognatishimia sp. 1_MG-2023]|uniref:GyrI-like domain-containing protein n=1 Tax=Cognatishimia sp. 1_MG-2023 TaxID=3062642 RepID=UPI0026E44ACC|nr:GyrI-like domain-containing protein [Cognatishimia sp. 1_MG-2023]MDO6727489.1 GyrI-like domain-containing protein [Cognatishimia sp. 1_MG-2023]
MNIEKQDFETQTYIYVQGKARITDPTAIAAAMGAAFAEIFGFIQKVGITPLSAPITVYTKIPGTNMKFRSGFFVTPEDAKKATGDVKADSIPAGSALHAQHVGPYMDLKQTHGAIWGYAKSHSLKSSMPVWEIYIDDPDKAPADKLRTEVYHTVT